MKNYHELKKGDLKEPILRIKCYTDGADLLLVNEDGDTLATLLSFSEGCIMAKNNAKASFDNFGIDKTFFVFDDEGALKIT